MTLPLWMRVTKVRLADNAPTILSGVAAGGLIATVALAIRATSKAVPVLDKARDEKESRAAYLEERAIMDGELRLKLTPRETVEATWKIYLPAAATGIATLACIIGSNQIGLRQKAALAGAYSIAELAFREYREEIVKTLGEKKESEAHERVMERRIAESKPDAQVIIVGGGDTLCFDAYTGRYFRSDIEKIRSAVIELKETILKDMFCDHNYFYHLLDLEDVVFGEALGWNIDHMPDVLFSSHLAPDGTPCLAVRFQVLPKVDYLRY
jgi:hypothetical protein